MGPAVTKEIGPEGGELVLPDQSIRIAIPAGALTGKTTIGIEPITNTNVAGRGQAYRLTPHGVRFSRPVAVTFSYLAYTDSLAMPAALALSYQGEDGIWRCMGGNEVDTTAKTVTVRTTHFSDWAGMNWIMLVPNRAICTEGAELEILAQVFIPTHGDILQEPQYNEEGYPVGDPQPLAGKFIKDWYYTGPGTFIATGNEALYIAPPVIEAPTVVAVNCELVSKNNHKYLLVCNVELRSNDVFEIRVNGGAWQRLNCKLMVGGGRVSISNSLAESEGMLTMGWPSSGQLQYVWQGDDDDNAAFFGYFPQPGNVSVFYNNDYDSETELHIPSPGGVTLTKFGAPGDYVEGTFLLNPVAQRRPNNQYENQKIEGRFRLKRFDF